MQLTFNLNHQQWDVKAFVCRNPKKQIFIDYPLNDVNTFLFVFFDVAFLFSFPEKFTYHLNNIRDLIPGQLRVDRQRQGRISSSH